MSKKSGKSKMITPTYDSKADSDFEEDTRQALAASRGQQVTTNTDPSEAGPSNLEQTSSPATTESVMFGPPTLGDIVDQVLSSVRSTAHQRRELDKQGQKIVKKDTNARPYTLEEFKTHFGNEEGIKQWQRALAYTTNVRLQEALRNHQAAYNTARERGLLPVSLPGDPMQRRIRGRPISAAYIDRIINFLNSILVWRRNIRIFSRGGSVDNNRVLIDFRTDYILDMPEVGGIPQNGHIHLTNNLDIDHSGTHVTIDIPSTWIDGAGARSMVMHVYRNGIINFKSPMFYRPIRINNFNLFTGTAIEAANNLQGLLNGENVWTPELVSGGQGRTIISFGTSDPEMSVIRVSDIIENIRNLLTYINIFLRIDSPIHIQFFKQTGGSKTRKRKRKLKKQTKNKKSKVRKSKRVKRKTRKQ
jgi:hypothetical protein